MKQDSPLKAADAAWQPPRRRLQPYLLHELEALPKREPLIKGVLDRGGMSVWYGESNCGKSFTAIDLALHVALGWDWCDRRVKPGKVLYIAAEGGLGIHERLKAFMQHHKPEKEPQFFLLPAAVNFCSDPVDAAEVIKEAGILGQIDLIVVDTLARAMSGGNENASEDMGAFIKNCDLIRERTRAQVVIIHHAGKDASRGSRGHSSLRAAVDTEIEVTKDEGGTITAEIKKQRDGATGAKFNFVLESVTLGEDEDGEPITSCVLLPTIPPPAQKSKVSGRKARALTILHNLLAERGERGIPKKGMAELTFVRMEDFRTALKDGNIIASDDADNVRRGISKVIESLNEKTITATWEDKIWIPG
jgi:hypothetical protein